MEDHQKLNEEADLIVKQLLERGQTRVQYVFV